MFNFEEILAQNGILSQHLPGYEPREAQQKMLNDIFEAYQNDRIVLIEAGTGTGKSLAYLIPALYWALEKGEPSVISTNTISLQEQLIHKDIPFLLNALELNAKAVLMKGMHNYLCLRKLEDLQEDKKVFSEREVKEIERIEVWAQKACEGSRSELNFTPNSDLWERVSAEAEACTHAKCPYYKKCFFFKARQEASDAHLLIVNHHLLFADLSVRQETENYSEPCILPAYQRLIIDEAHHIEDVAAEYFAKRVSKSSLFKQIARLHSDRGTGKLNSLHRKILEFYPLIDPDKRLQLILQKLLIDIPGEKNALMHLLDTSFDAVLAFFLIHQGEEKLRLRKTHFMDSAWQDNVQSALLFLVDGMRKWLHSIEGLVSLVIEDETLKKRCEGLIADLEGLLSRLNLQVNALMHMTEFGDDAKEVRWIEKYDSVNCILVSANLDIPHFLSETLFKHVSTIAFCSATLSVNREFTFIRKTLGIPSCKESLYDSPFDFSQQSLLGIPTDMHDPDHPYYTQDAAKKIWSIILASQGNAFVLFTSYQMLKECAMILSGYFQSQKYLLLCQGEESRYALLERFKKTEHAVLFGTDSFWEGVDVAGDALRCVIIVKLPFKVPSDPLFQARAEIIQSQGGSPFFDYSLPHAIMKFKQGFGRLIRHRNDRGCVVCLDPRIIKKGYGKLFFRSLPNCQIFSDSASKLIQTLSLFYSKFN